MYYFSELWILYLNFSWLGLIVTNIVYTSQENGLQKHIVKQTHKALAAELKQWCWQSHTRPLEFDILTSAHDEEMLENKESSFCMLWGHRQHRLKFQDKSLQNVWQKARRSYCPIRHDDLNWVCDWGRWQLFSFKTGHYVNNRTALKTECSLHTDEDLYTSKAKETNQSWLWWQIRGAYVSHLGCTFTKTVFSVIY